MKVLVLNGPNLGRLGTRLIEAGAIDRVEPRRDAVRGATFAEARGDDVAKNRGGDGVGEAALEPVTDLDAHLPLLQEDDEDLVALLEDVGADLDAAAHLALDGIAPAVHDGGDVLDDDGAAKVFGVEHGRAYRQCSTR